MAKQLSVKQAWNQYLSAKDKYAQDYFLHLVGVQLGAISEGDVRSMGKGIGSIVLTPGQREAILREASEKDL